VLRNIYKRNYEFQWTFPMDTSAHPQLWGLRARVDGPYGARFLRAGCLCCMGNAYGALKYSEKNWHLSESETQLAYQLLSAWMFRSKSFLPRYRHHRSEVGRTWRSGIPTPPTPGYKGLPPPAADPRTDLYSMTTSLNHLQSFPLCWCFIAAIHMSWFEKVQKIASRGFTRQQI